jgi:hypothetical protein
MRTGLQDHAESAAHRQGSRAPPAGLSGVQQLEAEAPAASTVLDGQAQVASTGGAQNHGGFRLQVLGPPARGWRSARKGPGPRAPGRRRVRPRRLRWTRRGRRPHCDSCGVAARGSAAGRGAQEAAAAGHRRDGVSGRPTAGGHAGAGVGKVGVAAAAAATTVGSLAPAAGSTTARWRQGPRGRANPWRRCGLSNCAEA